jgi:dienelactone hydrolase
MRTGRLCAASAALILALMAGSCSGHPAPPPPSVAPPSPAAPPPPAATTPEQPLPSYPVGRRVLHLQRNPARPLPTLIFYPATAPGLRPAPGRFPLVLFSHGLSGSPQRYATTLAAWAAAGFVVAAPTYPHTSQFATDFVRHDIVNQPADARYVLAQLRRLDVTRGDPLRHHIDTDHIAAIGHSAGGYTTTGLFTAGHDPRLRAAVIMAGWAAPGAFAGPPATVLFLQGTADPIVPVARSRATYARIPWPKSYLLLRRDSHATYLRPGGRGYLRMRSTVIDFLLWTLTGDPEASQRLPHTFHPPMRAVGPASRPQCSRSIATLPNTSPDSRCANASATAVNP